MRGLLVLCVFAVVPGPSFKTLPPVTEPDIAGDVARDVQPNKAKQIVVKGESGFYVSEFGDSTVFQDQYGEKVNPVFLSKGTFVWIYRSKTGYATRVIWFRGNPCE